MEWLLDFGEKYLALPFYFFGAQTNITPLNTLALLRSLAGTYSDFSHVQVRSDIMQGSNSHPLLKTSLVIWSPQLQMSPASLE